MKHTQGPWIAPKDQVNVVFRESDYDCPQVGALVKGFQCTVSLKQGEAQAIADASLISAAPEMLEMCKWMLKYCRKEGVDSTLECALEKLIAKASGDL